MFKQSRQSRIPSFRPDGCDYKYADFAGGIQIIQYRSYQRDIFIYHVRRHLLSLPLLRRALQSQKGYRDRLTSFDPIRYSVVVEGDEIPSGCIEAAYMPSILHSHGSALALRSDIEPGRVEWFIFSEPIHETVLSRIVYIDGGWNLQPGIDTNDPRKVFDLVGYAEKGLRTRTVRGANREHKGWHDSLCSAEEGKKNLRLTWKGYGNELKADQERRRREETIETADERERETDGLDLMDTGTS
ncbi:hypothetical protein OPT61_g2323 [Boeremia exigua]|uniref:Uncharacterized protein n=1 Tax=Boeremia exigua TaxID=749465 RepID=A0ACC2IM71_9PLEO|nr:hypothetical protein OPT61_g2323 [Boeremia exigua]